MSSFHNRFSPDPDPEMAEVRRLWVTDKPLLKDAVVTYAPPYPDYPEWEPEVRLGDRFSNPCSSSAREVDDKIEVSLHNNVNGFCDYHEQAWNSVIEDAAEIEVALRCKLLALHRKNLKQFLEDGLEGDYDTLAYWDQIKNKIGWDDSSAILYLYKLVGIGLIDEGLDECGFTSFEFQTGWDHDHGASILMHRANVLVAGGMGEYTYFQSSLIPTIKSVQAYDLDEGDLKLLDA